MTSRKRTSIIQESGIQSIPRFGLLPVPDLEGFTQRAKKLVATEDAPNEPTVQMREKPKPQIRLIPNKEEPKKSGVINTVLGLVGSAANITLKDTAQVQAQQKATELLSSASSFLSGVWGSGSPRMGRKHAS